VISTLFLFDGVAQGLKLHFNGGYVWSGFPNRRGNDLTGQLNHDSGRN
jgi:hypothetical protein